MMKQTDGEFRNRSGFRIFTRQWLPAGQMRGLVFLLHGLAEHCGRYAHVAEVLAREQLGVFALDHLGHGQSEGRRGDVQRFGQYVDDAYSYFQNITAGYPSLPRYLLGHSMGGLIALKFALRHQDDLQGLILSAPAIKVHGDISPFLQKIAGVIATLAPLLPVQILDATAISRDPAIVAAYDRDPLVYRGRVRARMGAELLRASNEMAANLESIRLPFWVGYGSADRLIDPVGSTWLYARAASRDKTQRAFDGLYHEIMNEPEKESVLAEIVGWLNAHRQ